MIGNRFLAKSIILICLCLNFFVILQILEPRDRNTATDSIPSKIRPNIDVVVAHCHENLSWLDQFNNCDNINIHVYSKCGNTTFPLFLNVSNCTSIHRIMNCGTAEMAYFHHIVQRYESSQLAPITAFIQGGAPHENPHIIHDIRSYMPGLSYADLTRSIKNAWMFRLSDVEKNLQNQTNAIVNRKGTWLSGWRSMFMASDSSIRRIPKHIYNEYIDSICARRCKQWLNCNLELWFSPFFGCTPDNYAGDACSTTLLNYTRIIIPEDYNKSGYHPREGRPAHTMTQITCGEQRIIFSHSSLNGILMCIDLRGLESLNFSKNLLELTSESSFMDFKDVHFGEKPQWYQIDANTVQQKELEAQALSQK